jgi:hypothetical protein
MEFPCILSFAIIVAPQLKCAAVGEEAQGLGWPKTGQPCKRLPTVIPIEIVITGLDPVIHLLRKNFLRRLMDARIKSGHDGCVLWSTPLSQDTESLETVIASEAKQSIAPQRKHGLLRCARNDEESGYGFALATRSARGVDESSAPIEGVGNAGCPLHPRPRVHLVVVERTRVTTSTPESPGIPARNGFNGFLHAPR